MVDSSVGPDDDGKIHLSSSSLILEIMWSSNKKLLMMMKQALENISEAWNKPNIDWNVNRQGCWDFKKKTEKMNTKQTIFGFA